MRTSGRRCGVSRVRGSRFEVRGGELLPKGEAAAVVAALCRGEEAEFSGLYRQEEFADGFCYRWSPVGLTEKSARG
jgi:hypothetical protein